VTPRTGRDLWRWRVERTPERPFLLHGGRTWTYAQFDDEVRRVAGGLRDLGVEQGTFVLTGLTNRPEALQIQHAIQELGAVQVPLVPGLTFNELSFPIHHSEARILVADDPVAAAVEEHRDECGLDTLVLGEDGLASLRADEPLAPARLERYDDRSLSYVLYTSGSTGRPKGVMLGSGSFASCGRNFVESWGFHSDDNYFLPLPVAHVIGALSAQAITITTGGRLTLVDRFSPSTFWQAVNGNGATISILFPAQLNLLLEADDGWPAHGETTFRLIVTHTDLPRFRDRYGIALGVTWGMTETGAICTASRVGYEGELGEGYVGRVPPRTEIACFDEGFRRLPPGEHGEICLQHEHNMLGYLKDADATAASLVGGWVRSGDHGVVDEHGEVFFRGRIKNMIKRSGENIAAEEVEAALTAHPDVAEAAAFGVADPIRSEEVAAVVVRRSGAEVEPGELRAFCADTLARWKLPRYFVVRDDALPRLPNGKVDGVTLRASVVVAEAWDAEAAAPRR
jgi:crotonobetaine/carnitine-CoA ligase